VTAASEERAGIAESGSRSTEVRKAAIAALGGLPGDPPRAALLKLCSASGPKEDIKAAAIAALVPRSVANAAAQAVSFLGTASDAKARTTVFQAFLRAKDGAATLAAAFERAASPLSADAAAYLQGAGVELRLGQKVETIAPGRVSLSGAAGASELEAATICWTAGVRASRLGRLLSDQTGCPIDRSGRLVVEPDFSIPGHPEIRAVGDLCSFAHTPDGSPLPGMAGPAVQAGGWVARDILARLRGHTIQPFRWLDLGSMAVIGPWYAVADLRGLHLTGLVGWVVWALAHLAFIPDTENRIALFSKWMWQIATRQRTALLITGRPDQHLGVDVGLFRAPRPTA
jgi:NADH dehydrogenase FAD-containing subunit